MALQLSVGPVGGAARRRPPFFKTKKVGLLGSTESLHFAPWGDPSWTLIAHPCCRGACKREPDWYFDMHRRECFQVDHKSWNPKYYKWLQKLQTPIFMQEDWPDIPMAVRYPREIVEAQFFTSVTGQLYATNHCAYMIPLAMMEGVEEIGLFGCQYSGPDRGAQRDSLTYWIGRFEGWGGRVIVPRKYNSLCVMPLYGYESHDEHGKLVEAYRPALVATRPTPSGGVKRAPLTEVNPNSAEGRIPLMPPPNGAPIAWDRSGHLVHA